MKEDAIHKDIALFLNYRIKNPDDFWTYMPFGEQRTKITGALLKAKGTKKGVPDFMILQRRNGITRVIWLEVKTNKGKQSPEQKEFENQTKASNHESYHVVHDIDEVAEVLKFYNF